MFRAFDCPAGGHRDEGPRSSRVARDRDPILTPGTPLATRADWAEIVAAAKECGAHARWVAFDGHGGEHDRQLSRLDAFEETCLAVRRARESGLGTGGGVFFTEPALRNFDRLLSVLLGLRLDRCAITLEGYTPTARKRQYETRGPNWATCPDARRVLDESLPGRDVWSNLEAQAEAARVRRAGAAAGLRPAPTEAPALPRVPSKASTCTPGAAAIYRRRYGNMRRDGAQAVPDQAR